MEPQQSDTEMVEEVASAESCSGADASVGAVSPRDESEDVASAESGSGAQMMTLRQRLHDQSEDVVSTESGSGAGSGAGMGAVSPDGKAEKPKLVTIVFADKSRVSISRASAKLMEPVAVVSVTS